MQQKKDWRFVSSSNICSLKEGTWFWEKIKQYFPDFDFNRVLASREVKALFSSICQLNKMDRRAAFNEGNFCVGNIVIDVEGNCHKLTGVSAEVAWLYAEDDRLDPRECRKLRTAADLTKSRPSPQREEQEPAAIACPKCNTTSWQWRNGRGCPMCG